MKSLFNRQKAKRTSDFLVYRKLYKKVLEEEAGAARCFYDLQKTKAVNRLFTCLLMMFFTKCGAGENSWYLIQRMLLLQTLFRANPDQKFFMKHYRNDFDDYNIYIDRLNKSGIFNFKTLPKRLFEKKIPNTSIDKKMLKNDGHKYTGRGIKMFGMETLFLEQGIPEPLPRMEKFFK